MLYYAMTLTGTCATRVGRMSTDPVKVLRIAKRAPHGFVERYGDGVVWTPDTGWRDPALAAIESNARRA